MRGGLQIAYCCLFSAPSGGHKARPLYRFGRQRDVGARLIRARSGPIFRQPQRQRILLLHLTAFVPDHLESISELTYFVTPAKAGIQNSYESLDSGFRRNDVQRPLCHFEMVS